MKTFRLTPIIIIAVLTSILLGSCEKESPAPDSFIGVLKSTAADYDFSDAVTVYGPLKIERSNSTPAAIINEIQLPDYECYEPVFLVEILSGTSDGSNSVSSAVIKINDEIILSQSDFNNKTLYYSSVLELPENITLEVKINGQPADFVTVEIKGMKICSECGGAFIDERDGREYKTVQIGDQCWMAENLAYLPQVSPKTAYSTVSPTYHVYQYLGTNISEAKSTDNYKNFGVLYNFPAAMESCPEGWHLASDEDWKELEIYIGMSQSEADKIAAWRGTDEGYQLKSASGWISDGNGIDKYGFTILPAGYRSASGGFSSLGYSAYYTMMGETSSILRSLNYSRGTVSRENGESARAYGFSVRCIKD